MRRKKGKAARQGPGNRLLIVLLIIAVFFSLVGRAVLSPLMPYLQQELSLSLATVGTLFLLVSVSFSVVMICSGYLTAWVGHGNTVVAALLMIMIGLIISASAVNVATLTVGVILIGAGGGTYAPSGIAMINTKISIERRSSVFAFHELGSNGAVLLAPLIVLVGVPLVGWRGVLLLLGGLAGTASIVFYFLGAPESGVGVKPNLSIFGKILRLPNAYVGMLMFSTSLAGLHGVFAILPAYLVQHTTWAPEHVNSLITFSRLISILMLFLAGTIINKIGKRNTIFAVLMFTGVLTGLISVAEGRLLEIVVVFQPALIAVMFPAQLSCLAEIGESWYQNVTTALVVTVGMTFGAGVVPAFIGVMGDLGIGWLGFISLTILMFLAAVVLKFNPSFGKS